LSEKFYYTKDLSKALKDYNKEHPQGTDNVRRGEDPLQGEKIFIPPVAMLPGAETVKPVAPATGGAADVAPANLPTSKVTKENTYIVNVAYDQLKNGDRWGELLKLNPGIDAMKVLAIGTIVRLPPDAGGTPPPVH
jgi:hypothetical protein